MLFMLAEITNMHQRALKSVQNMSSKVQMKTITGSVDYLV